MQYTHCPETTSKTSFQTKKGLVYAYFKVKKFRKNSPDSPCILVYTFQMKKISLKIHGSVYSANYEKS